jgi:predicted DCC family thiol-disulfide oxidoreductase YuxK
MPAFIREPIYKWIARNRYKWFGKKEECMVPSPEIKSRFL